MVHVNVPGIQITAGLFGKRLKSCLQAEQEEFDRERQELRSYIIKRCSKPVAFMYGNTDAQQVGCFAVYAICESEVTWISLIIDSQSPNLVLVLAVC